MSDPTTTNGLANAVNGVLKGVIESASETEVEGLILAASPEIVAIPIVGAIYSALIDWVVSKLGTYFYTQVALGVTKIIIDLQVNAEASTATTAFSNLQTAVQSGDQAAIDQASKDLDQAYSGLIHYDGSAAP